MSAWSHMLQKDNKLTLAKSFLPTLRCSWEKLSPLVDLFTPEPAEVQVREVCVCGGGKPDSSQGPVVFCMLPVVAYWLWRCCSSQGNEKYPAFSPWVERVGVTAPSASEEAWEGCEKAERNARWKSGVHADSRTFKVY